MSLPSIDPVYVKWLGAGLMVFAMLVTTFLFVCDPEALPRRYYVRYIAYLERKLRGMFLFTRGGVIALAQAVALFAILAAYLLVDLPMPGVFAAVVVFAPSLYIERMRVRRVAAIEAQIDGFVLALANALKATPSIGDAFRSVQPIIRDPLRQEIELALKEMRLGASLDQALLLMAGRVGSRQLDSALSALLIGRQIGGNLPKILETTAGSLREMNRLEGVVRTKTAEGKVQMWVLAAFPLLMILGFNAVSPGYFSPLTDGVAGIVVAVFATLFWGAALVLARKILAVDI